MKKLLDKPVISLLSKALGDSKLHLVGGCVRDFILNKTPKDLDFSTVLNPDQVVSKLEIAGIPFIVTGLRRGTITAIINKEPIEITTFRNPENEKEYVNDIIIDLAARDFTINAIAVNVETGGLIDPYKGIEDLHSNILRCVGDPLKRFKEDPHRILRMIRFGPGQDRLVSQETTEAAKSLVGLVRLVSPERIHDELIKIVCTEKADSALRDMYSVGLMDILMPELSKTVGMEQNKYHKYDVFEHILGVLVGVPREKIIRFAALFHDIGKPECLSIEKGMRHFYGHEKVSERIALNILKRYKFSNEDIKRITELVGKHQYPLEKCGNPATRRLLRELGDSGIKDLIILKLADFKAGHTADYSEDVLKFQKRVDELSKVKDSFLKLNITGNDIMSTFDLKEGPEVGHLLKKAKDAVLEDPSLNTKEGLILFLRQFV